MSSRLITTAVAAATLVVGIGIGVAVSPSAQGGDGQAVGAAAGSSAGVSNDPAVNLATLKATSPPNRDLFLADMGASQVVQLWKLADQPYTGGDTTWVSDVAREMHRRGLVTEPVATVPAAPVAVATPAGPATSFGPGIHTVGDEVAPGVYRTAGPTGIGCYWERERGLDGEFRSLIANGNLSGPGTIEVKASDAAIKITGSCYWTKK